MNNFDSILNNLINNEVAKHKCPYCWSTVVDNKGELYCEKCYVKVEKCCELI